MAIKYLRGIYGVGQARTSRPLSFSFPLGLKSTATTDTANSANTTTASTFDVMVIAGGGRSPYSSVAGGGGGGGIRIFSGNTFSEIAEFSCLDFADAVNSRTFIPVTVGGSETSSCFGCGIVACQGGNGGVQNGGGGGGGSGGGGGRGNPIGPEGGPPFISTPGGPGIFGQGCNGGNGGGSNVGGAGGSACANASQNGIVSSITGACVQYSCGGRGSFGANNPSAAPAAVNSGSGGGGSASVGPGATTPGGSGRVAIRYRNPAAPTTPLAQGGNCVCCTGGCIIHIFNSSGFLNVNTTAIVN
jgi:hypothetical protein